LFLVPDGDFFQLVDASQWAPFLIVGRDPAGRWRQVDPVFLEWGPPFVKRQGRSGKPQWVWATQRYRFLSVGRIETPDLQDRLFELDEGWAFLDRHHGFIWIFDGKGALKRRIPIYEDLKETDLDLPSMAFPMAVLACEAAPGGKLILAARNDIAFFFSRKVWPRDADPANPPLAASLLVRETQAAKDFPDLAWMAVDTRSGDVKSMPAPPEQPSKYTFRPGDPNWHFRFTVNPEGQVVSHDPAPPAMK
jgi:hypothetical protein